MSCVPVLNKTCTGFGFEKVQDKEVRQIPHSLARLFLYIKTAAFPCHEDGACFLLLSQILVTSRIWDVHSNLGFLVSIFLFKAAAPELLPMVASVPWSCEVRGQAPCSQLCYRQIQLRFVSNFCVASVFKIAYCRNICFLLNLSWKLPLRKGFSSKKEFGHAEWS